MPGMIDNMNIQEMAFLSQASEIAEKQISMQEAKALYIRTVEREGLAEMDIKQQGMTCAALLVSQLRICALIALQGLEGPGLDAALERIQNNGN